MIPQIIIIIGTSLHIVMIAMQLVSVYRGDWRAGFESTSIYIMVRHCLGGFYVI